MACIDVTVQQITSGITVSAEVISCPSREDILPRNQLCVLAEVISSNLTVIASAVCTVNTGGGEETVLYLEIEPEVLWVYPDYERENFVYSNTEWFIE